MKEEDVKNFKIACENFLSKKTINILRVYGRYLKLRAPCMQKKSDLIKSIIQVYCGECKAERSNLGKPVKDDYLPVELIKEMENLRETYFGEEKFDIFEEEKEPQQKEKGSRACKIEKGGNVTIFPDTLALMKAKAGDSIKQARYIGEEGEVIVVFKK